MDVTLGTIPCRLDVVQLLLPPRPNQRACARRRYVEGTFPEINKAKVIEAAFSGQVGCKVFQWGVADLAALMMKLGYFAGPS